MDRPKVVKRERKLYISHDTTEQVYCAAIYPLLAPNNSSIIIQGHADGIQISWRGGRRRKSPAVSSHIDVIMISDSDDEQPPVEGDVQYEDDEEELDPDCPYPSTVHALKINLGCPVTSIAGPSPAEITARDCVHLLKTHIVIVATCADGTIRALTVPLTPPSDDEVKRRSEHCKKNAILIESEKSVGIGNVTVKTRIVKSDAHQTRSKSRSREADEGELLVASTSNHLNIWRMSITPEGLQAPEALLIQSVPLSAAGNQCSFHPSPLSTQILVASRDGVLRIYDPFLPKSNLRRPSSQDSASPNVYSNTSFGKWVANYHTEFQAPKEDPMANPAMAQRKRMLDSKWILSGKGILVLLEDGEWGIWDLSGNFQSLSKHIDDFVLHGFLGSAAPSDTTTVPKSGTSQRLAPMTPNTRKTKSVQLFGGPSKTTGAAPKGGITVASAHNTGHSTEESVAMWYNGDVYTINNLTSFFQRGTNQGAISGGGFGSLYAPGLTQVHDLNLFSETIISVSQFSVSPVSNSSSSFGQVNLQRDLLIATEHHITIIHNLRGSTTSRQLFQQPIAAAERPTVNDQAMLEVGMLDLGGMDRMLDSMANGDGIVGMRARRVGFAG